MYPLSKYFLNNCNISKALSLFKVSSSLKIFPFLVYAIVRNDVVAISSALRGNNIGYSITLFCLSFSNAASISSQFLGYSPSFIPAFSNISLFKYESLIPLA